MYVNILFLNNSLRFTKVHSVLAPESAVRLQWIPEEFRFKDKGSIDVKNLKNNDDLFFCGSLTQIKSRQSKQRDTHPTDISLSSCQITYSRNINIGYTFK
jgi:hypothetical protein